MRSTSIFACAALYLQLAAPSPTLDASHARRQAKALAVRADHEGDIHMADAPSSDTASSVDTVQLPPLTGAEFKLKAQKGRQFYDWMGITSIKELDKAMQKAGRISQGQSSQSSFVDPADIAHGGWIDSDEEQPQELDDSQCNLPTPVCDVLQSLGVSTKTRAAGGYNESSYLSQQDREFDGEEHEHYTDAMVYAVYNTKEGVLISASALSPKEALPKWLRVLGLSEDELNRIVQNKNSIPRLQKLSDLLYLRYLEQAQKNKDDPKKLRYFIGLGIHNSQAVQLHDYLLKSKGFPSQPWKTSLGHAGDYRAPEWPKQLIFTPKDKDPEPFYSLIDSQNSKAWLLLQHKKQLGNKRMSKIHMFHQSSKVEGYKGANLLMELENLDANGKAMAWPKEGLRGKQKLQAGSSRGAVRRRGLSRL